MKKIYSVMFALLTVFGLAGNSAANTFDLGLLVSPGAYAIGNDTYKSLPSGSGAVSDDWLFEVNLPSSFGAAVTSISVITTGDFTSFNTRLSVWTGSWTQIASDIGDNFGTYWSSSLEFSPLSASPTEYKLTVFGDKLAGYGSYGGNISVSPVAPIPEPEIYAMLAAGLGLMGFAARRRKQFHDAVV